MGVGCTTQNEACQASNFERKGTLGGAATVRERVYRGEWMRYFINIRVLRRTCIATNRVL